MEADDFKWIASEKKKTGNRAGQRRWRLRAKYVIGFLWMLVALKKKIDTIQINFNRTPNVYGSRARPFRSAHARNNASRRRRVELRARSNDIKNVGCENTTNAERNEYKLASHVRANRRHASLRISSVGSARSNFLVCADDNSVFVALID